MADKRKKLSTHYVVRTVIERVDKTGVVPYNGSDEEATQIDRHVTEIGNFTVTGVNLNKALERAQTALEINGE